MKKYFLLVLLFAASHGYSKAIPRPSVLFSISESILTHVQEFIFSIPEKEIQKPAKIKPAAKVKAKAAKVIEAADAKPTNKSEIKVYRDGMWIVAE